MILEIVEALLLDIALLRMLETAEIKLVPGRALMARVIAREPSGRGQIAIAGVKIDARLPSDVRSGDELRLVVKDVTPERVTLTMAPIALAAGAAPPPGVRAEDASEKVADREGGHGSGGGPAAQSVSLRFPAPTLGAIDLRLDLDPESGALHATVALAEGEPVALARTRVEELRTALAVAAPGEVGVTLRARRDPLDVYA